jgi:hypothetical protein
MHEFMKKLAKDTHRSFRPVRIDEVQSFWGDVLCVLEEVTTLNLILHRWNWFCIEVYTGPFGRDPPVRNTVLIANGIRVDQLDRFDELDDIRKTARAFSCFSCLSAHKSGK